MGEGLEVGVVWRAGEGDHVTDVGHASDEEDESLEAQSEARMWCLAIATGVEVPP